MSLLPFSSPIIMPLRMGMGSVPPWEVALSLGVLVLSCAGGIWVSARIYRTGLLMYGKRPTFGEMARWVGRAG
jgi:ABC-2 type transport system permease protein